MKKSENKNQISSELTSEEALQLWNSLAKEYYSDVKNRKAHKDRPIRRKRKQDVSEQQEKKRKRINRNLPPSDTLIIIFSFIDIPNLYKNVQRVCKDFKELIDHHEKWIISDHKSFSIHTRSRKPKDIARVQKFFEYFENLKHLNISGSNIEEKTILDLVEKNKQTLESVNFTNCRTLNNESCSILFSLSNCPNLKRVYVGGNTIIAEHLYSIPNAKQFQVVHLNRCYTISSYYVTLLLRTCGESLLDLNLSECKTLSGEIISTICKFNTNLRRLNISGLSNIDDKHVQQLQNLTKLEYLNIAAKPQCGIIQVTKSLRFLKQIKELDISDNTSFYQERVFTNQIFELTKLEKLYMDGNIGFTIHENLISELKRKLPKLKIIKYKNTLMRKINNTWQFFATE